MKNLKCLALAVLGIVLFAIAASAQSHPMKDVPAAAKYHSTLDGFNIDLPADWVHVDSTKEGNIYTWKFTEGVVIVQIDQAAKPFKTEKDIADHVHDFKTNELNEAHKIKILSESPAKIGEYRGEAFVVESNGVKCVFILLAWDKFAITLFGSPEAGDADVQKRILEAVQSFEFVN